MVPAVSGPPGGREEPETASSDRIPMKSNGFHAVGYYSRIEITMENILNFRFCETRNRGGNLVCGGAIGTLSIVFEGLNTL